MLEGDRLSMDTDTEGWQSKGWGRMAKQIGQKEGDTYGHILSPRTTRRSFLMSNMLIIRH